MDLKSIVEGTHFDHSKKVSQISALLATKAGYTEKDISVIEQAALYHDIGKSSIPASILNKPGKLTPEEFEIVKTHTKLGYEQIMEAVRILLVAAVVSQEHHERLDSTGYLHLPGREIHPYAKLISVADVFDALISRRAYKEPWDIHTIADFFQEEAGKQFEYDLVNLLLGALDEILVIYKKPEGSAKPAGEQAC